MDTEPQQRLISRRFGPIVSHPEPGDVKESAGMNAKEEKRVLLAPEAKRLPPWKSSLYEEPTWVSLAWIIGPMLFAGVAIYFFSVR
jgi:hypothetical protein